jgi:major type 1 subunit fimbrin (pilin)
MKTIQIFAAACLVSATAGSAFAADATLNFNGNILAAACTVDSSSANQTITLDPALVSDFPAVGATKNPAAFNLNLTNCTNGAHVMMTVTGTTDTVTSVLKNTGSATQVGVQLLSASSAGSTTGTAITINNARDMGVVDATNAMTIPMVAQYYRIGTMTAGTVAATATVNFTYN